MTPAEALEQVRALHEPIHLECACHGSHQCPNSMTICPSCQVDWPCREVAILDAVTADEPARKAGLFDTLAAISHEGCTCPKIHPHHFDAILDAVTPDAAVTVETVEQLEVLPVGTIIQERTGGLLVRNTDDDSWDLGGFGGHAFASGLITLPATVLTPATPERTEQEREAAVERVAEAICGADPSHLSRWPLEAERRFCGVCWEKAPSAIAAYEGREVSE